MNKKNENKAITEIFKQYDVKHLPVVERMIFDINRRILKERSRSLVFFDKFRSSGHTQLPEKILQSNTLPRLSMELSKKRGKYPGLDEFYIRLDQDIQKRRIKSKIRQQIKKILDKEKEYPRIARTVSALKPHIPHKYANEESEIEKLYGLPGEPI